MSAEMLAGFFSVFSSFSIAFYFSLSFYISLFPARVHRIRALTLISFSFNADLFGTFFTHCASSLGRIMAGVRSYFCWVAGQHLAHITASIILFITSFLFIHCVALFRWPNTGNL